MAVEIKETMDEFGNPLLELTDPAKTKATFSVAKSFDGFAFYEVRISSGKLPAELSSMYTSQKAAQKAVEFYLNKMSKSNTIKRQEIREAREAQKK